MGPLRAHSWRYQAILCISVILLNNWETVLSQKSFAETKFELDSDLPAEGSPASESKDSKPAEIAKEEAKPVTTPLPIPPTTPKPHGEQAAIQPISADATPQTPLTPVGLPVTLPPVPGAPPATPAAFLPTLIPLPSLATLAPGTPLAPPPLPTPAPLFPPLPALQPHQPIVPVAPAPTPFSHSHQPQPSPQIQVQPSQLVPLSHNPSPAVLPVNALYQANAVTPSSPQQINSNTANHGLQVQNSIGSSTRQRQDRPELWFREDFDTTNCPRDAAAITRAFRRKFPNNLLRNGKETVLAELLSSRIKECNEKQLKDHWNRVDRLLFSANIPNTEKDECRAGLVQEQIGCLNVLNYSCQFIQPAYNFRLIPTRLIVQEARFAEDGADKCRKFVRKFKQQLS
ncbi:filamentous hemagglutinin [Ditylenchus destructor]|uniref:Filamentous hemagglutinin n=1 Tax=Ditylenchus destructor TaxID=166010 RepID=A0AAD4R5J5_9BILA|nr:filamentous hemagglutinin [Ditylenchus destructor]